MKKVKSKNEIMHCLKDTIRKNDIAIDFINSEMLRRKDLVSYNPDDLNSKEEIKILEYILFSLNYLDDTYRKSYKKLGGKLF